MIDNQLLREISERLSKVLPAAEELRGDVRTKIEQSLKKSLQDLDVLTREEFEAQAAALARAERRVAELEQTLQTLESRLASLESSA